MIIKVRLLLDHQGISVILVETDELLFAREEENKMIDSD